MRNAETVLATIHTRGQRGLPIRDLYRMLFIPDLYLRAYHKLYPNRGALTPGATLETVDGMALAKIHQLIDDVRDERHRWTPVRRVYIAKRNGRLRPLGIPSWKDKLLQEVIRTILEAYYEPQFSPLSHGFRPHRGGHTALQTIQSTWKGTRWFIEGDLASYFDTINHEVLLGIRSEQLHDNRFLRLLMLVGETMRYALNQLAQVVPDWLRALSPEAWFERYSRRVEQYRLPTSKQERSALAASIGADGFALLSAVYASSAPLQARAVGAVDILRQVWLQQYYARPRMAAPAGARPMIVRVPLN